ncbi:MAG: alkylation response protein AidB-like acyl-CoA dehydrogenase [Candidatus Azotimanducaceae bacterium]|jgi:alkylation response protein AidB-like acyl-CoA dehydrogenase
MEFGFSEEQILLQDSINKFLSEEVPLDEVRKLCIKIEDKSVWMSLADLGIAGMLIPEAYGGVGLGTLEAAIVSEQLGFHVTPSPFISSAVIAPTILLSAKRHLDLLPSLADGSTRIGIAIGDALALRHDKGIVANKGLLNGKASFVLDSHADAYLVATQNKSIYLVNAIDVTRNNRTSIDLTRSTCELLLEGCKASLVSNDSHIFDQAINIGRIMLAADTLGAGQNMVEKSVAYAKERKQFDRTIASFQAVKHMCAEMTADLEPCRSMVWYASHAYDNLPQETAFTSCQCKAHLSEIGKFVAKTSTEVHGGMGFTDLVGLHYWFKRIGFNRQILGTPEMLREEAARLQGLIA